MTARPILLLLLSFPVFAAQTGPSDLDLFKTAWQAAGRGDRAEFERIKNGLGDYLLFPYLQYEDFRYRRATVEPAELDAFIQEHSDWAFAEGLRRAWLRTMGQQGKWDDVLRYAPGEKDTEIQCYLAQARIQRGETDGLLPQAQALWAVGRSQPDACDPVFLWLRKARGIPPALAWKRVSRAMESRNPRLTLYLARFVSPQDRVWVDRWQQQELQRYARLDQARHWPDKEKARTIVAFGLKFLARNEADKAWKFFKTLNGKFHWQEEERAAILREIALWSAVALSPDAPVRLHAVPGPARDDQLLEWWARYGLATSKWEEVTAAVSAMSDESRNRARWRYWYARARLNTGDPGDAGERLAALSREANYYGFLAADFLDRPYAICPEKPQVSKQALAQFGARPEMQRVAALRDAGLKNWARREWYLATKPLGRDDLRLAAALAAGHGWHDLAIVALADSGDTTWYEWRFPLDFASLVAEPADRNGLDPAWVMGVMRSESAMAEDAISSANARGLMQVLPGTAAQVARRHGYTYTGSDQLLNAKDNIVFGTTYLGELMERFDRNPVLALGAYNAGPQVVDRWLDALPLHDPAVWIENLPYFETREYIPRVLAFSAIYDWRLHRPVQRISARMPALDSGTMGKPPAGAAVAEVICPQPEAEAESGR